MLPANHPLAQAPTVAAADLAHELGSGRLGGSAAELVERFLSRHGLDSTRAGQGDQPEIRIKQTTGD